MSSPRVCYLHRADRGLRLTGARLVGVRSEERWVPPADPASASSAVPGSGDLPLEIRSRIECCAGWLKEQITSGRGGSTLDVMCLDADAAACAWLTAPSADPSVVSAVIRQRTSVGFDADGGQSSAVATLAAIQGDRAEIDVQAVMPPAPARTRKQRKQEAGAALAGIRLPLLAVPDVAARLLLDELDRRGIETLTAMTIWHAMSLAWEPRTRRASSQAAGNTTSGPAPAIVSETLSTTGVVLIDPDGARLLWSWSRGGELLAAGSMLLPQLGGVSDADERAEAEAPSVMVLPDHVARLATEFLAWSAQTGGAPSRLVIASPELSSSDGGLTLAELGESIGRLWTETSVHAASDEDPIGLTLRKLAEYLDTDAINAEDPRTSLVGLTNRPGRTHRAMYTWAALSVAALAFIVGAIAWRLGDGADRFRADAARARTDARETVGQLRPALATSPFMVQDLEIELDAARKRVVPADALPAARPILQELDAISFVLGMPTIFLEDVTLGPSNAIVTFYAPDTETVADIDEAIRSVEGSSVDWKMEVQTVPGAPERRVRCTLSGPWKRGGS